MPIRDEYINVIKELAQLFGHTQGHYRIPENASIQQCLGYALRYISGNSTVHYRYDRYRTQLRRSLRAHNDFCRTGTVVHVDIGCGPGLFSWVVHDHFNDADVKLQLYGYDHATEMVRLAELIQDELESTIRVRFCHEIPQLLADLPCGSSRGDVIVTFGHVLVQLANNQQAIEEFAIILEHLTQIGRCLVLAVDAHSYPAPFQLSYNHLCKVLKTRHCVWEHEKVTGSNGFGLLRRK